MPAPKSPSGWVWGVERGAIFEQEAAFAGAIEDVEVRREERLAGGSDGGGGVGDGLTGLAEQVTNGVLKPLGLVVLTTERIQEVLDDAAERGRVTRSDANDLVAQLVSRGRQQTDQLLSDVERLIGRGREQLSPASRGSRWSESIDLLVRSADRARPLGRSRSVVPDPRLRRPDLRPGPSAPRGPRAGRAAQGARVRAASRQPEIGARGDRQDACSPLATARGNPCSSRRRRRGHSATATSVPSTSCSGCSARRMVSRRACSRRSASPTNPCVRRSSGCWVWASTIQATTCRPPARPRPRSNAPAARRPCLGAEQLGTEHILLALMREDGGAASRILRQLDVDPVAVRSAISASES